MSDEERARMLIEELRKLEDKREIIENKIERITEELDKLYKKNGGK